MKAAWYTLWSNKHFRPGQCVAQLQSRISHGPDGGQGAVYTGQRLCRLTDAAMGSEERHLIIPDTA